jgi:hypothetical protein
MNQIENAAVYHVCAVSEERWDVLRDHSAEPVASFGNRHTALAYAMNLARAPAGGLSLGRQSELLGAICRIPRGTRGTSN